jgi:hypothetical protein
MEKEISKVIIAPGFEIGFRFFLGVKKRFYKRLRPLVCWSIGCFDGPHDEILRKEEEEEIL